MSKKTLIKVTTPKSCPKCHTALRVGKVAQVKGGKIVHPTCAGKGK